jgi:hypothetical protein
MSYLLLILVTITKNDLLLDLNQLKFNNLKIRNYEKIKIRRQTKPEKRNSSTS